MIHQCWHILESYSSFSNLHLRKGFSDKEQKLWETDVEEKSIFQAFEHHMLACQGPNSFLLSAFYSDGSAFFTYSPTRYRIHSQSAYHSVSPSAVTERLENISKNLYRI